MSDQQGPQTGEPAPEPVIVKKYANRRLYDTATSAYVTLEDLADMVKRGVDFVVYDAKTNEDLTRQILGQIIMEEESRGQTLLPIPFLRQLIRFYGAGAAPAMLPSYLEMSLDAFARQQERLREAFGAGPNYFEDQVRQNAAMFERAMQMFSPLAYARAEPPPEQPATDKPDELAELRKRIEEMSRQIERLAGGR